MKKAALGGLCLVSPVLGIQVMRFACLPPESGKPRYSCKIRGTNRKNSREAVMNKTGALATGVGTLLMFAGIAYCVWYWTRVESPQAPHDVQACVQARMADSAGNPASKDEAAWRKSIESACKNQ
ncbi:MAG TPA: hypothetical protein VF534_27450 [Paraburkholderia sp.]